MLRNYFKTAWRSLRANKVYSLITVAGLGVGIAVCLVIFVFIQYEQSWDGYHKNKDRIFRVMTKGDKVDDVTLGCVPWPLPTALENDFKDWKIAGITSLGEVQVMAMGKDGQAGNKFKEKDGFFMVQPALFSILDLPWLAGSPEKSLQDQTSIVLSRSTAEKYFGDWQEAMGRTIKLENHELHTVTGIIADAPPNTDVNLKMVLNYQYSFAPRSTDWWSVNSIHECYVLLPPGETVANAELRLKAASKKYRTPDNHNTQLLQPLSEVHYDAKATNFSGKTIARERIRSLWLLAGFILLIAGVNFVNISTALAVNRAREVGVRKVLGGRRGQLTLQFVIEAFLLVAMSILLAAGVTALLLKPVDRMLEMPLGLEVFTEVPVLLFLLAILLGVSLLAGSYPAFVLAGFNPVTALKSKVAPRGILLRRGLVVLQFVIAQALIIGTLLVVRQMDFMTHTSMGFDKNAIVTVPSPGDSLSVTKRSYLRDRLMAIKDVRMVSYSNSTPASGDNWWTDFKFDHAAKSANVWVVERWIDADYLATYSVSLAAGRNITRNDSVLEYLVNETVVKKLGFTHPEDVLNKQLDNSDGNRVGKIVGVVRDFHQSSLKDSMAGVLMFSDSRNYNVAAIKMTGENLPATIEAIRQVWAKVYPDFVFEYQFVDEAIANFYKEEAKISLIYKVFAAIAIFLSCLGLYGLASFMAAQRLKEVGIRKVLGASAANIVYLFSKEFVALIGIAFLIASPIAWYFVHKWLDQYAYRTAISGWVFVVGGLAALVIALMTVGWQALRAALANPVKSLRRE